MQLMKWMCYGFKSVRDLINAVFTKSLDQETLFHYKVGKTKSGFNIEKFNEANVKQAYWLFKIQRKSKKFYYKNTCTENLAFQQLNLQILFCQK